MISPKRPEKQSKKPSKLNLNILYFRLLSYRYKMFSYYSTSRPRYVITDIFLSLGFLYGSSPVISVFWLNVDKQIGVWKLHRDSCRFCNPNGTALKGVNHMKSNGGWFQFESYQGAYTFFQKDHKNIEYWQPCRTCNPE